MAAAHAIRRALRAGARAGCDGRQARDCRRRRHAVRSAAADGCALPGSEDWRRREDRHREGAVRAEQIARPGAAIRERRHRQRRHRLDDDTAAGGSAAANAAATTAHATAVDHPRPHAARSYPDCARHHAAVRARQSGAVRQLDQCRPGRAPVRAAHAGRPRRPQRRAHLVHRLQRQGQSRRRLEGLAVSRRGESGFHQRRTPVDVCPHADATVPGKSQRYAGSQCSGVAVDTRARSAGIRSGNDRPRQLTQVARAESARQRRPQRRVAQRQCRCE